MLIHTTGAHPFCPVRQAARVGGCIDAPDFIPTGATGCELAAPIWGRDEVAAQIEAINVVEWLRRATAQTLAIEAWRTAWEARTAADVRLVADYIRTLNVDQIRDLTERTAWAAGRVERQRKTPAGSTEYWGSLMCEVEFTAV